jgi:glutamyl-Q tRNA(Asp) synthetase
MTETLPHPRYRGRFAPSPTGPLHFGSLVAAWGSWLLARHHQGEWLVRVEDLDPPREVQGAAHAQLATLAAFGMTSDLPVVWQSQRHARYAHALERLLAGGAAFECRCSRSELASVGGIHRRCVARAPFRPAAVRLQVAEGTTVDFIDGLQGRIAQAVDRAVGDVVLRRADGYWAYQLAVVVDDAEQGITDVVRGADLLDSTPRQILLQRALGLPTPRYLHLPLIVDAHGDKLSKSMAALPVDDASPLPALRAAWQALGQAPALLAGLPTVAQAMQAAARGFRPERLPKVTHMTFAAAHNTPVAGAV